MPPTVQPHDHPQGVGTDGMVQVYDIPAQKWTKRASVDAKEMCAVGTGSYSGPAIEMTGPAGTIMVCREEVLSHEAAGYKVVGEKKSLKISGSTDDGDADSGGEGDTTEDDGDTPEPYDFSAHTMPELRAFADEAEVNHNGMNKAALVQALTDKGFVPTPD